MHDEVSDTENIRKNLAIERMIVEGCDILLDTSQTFVRQGKSLLSRQQSSGAFPDRLLLPGKAPDLRAQTRYLGGAQSLNHDFNYCNSFHWGRFVSL